MTKQTKQPVVATTNVHSRSATVRSYAVKESTVQPGKLLVAFTLGLSVTAASATSMVATLDAIGRSIEGSSNATSDVSSSGSSSDHKIVRAAKDDAASFVASDGTIRGARLEGALLELRESARYLHMSDMQLANAILAIEL